MARHRCELLLIALLLPIQLGAQDVRRTSGGAYNYEVLGPDSQVVSRGRFLLLDTPVSLDDLTERVVQRSRWLIGRSQTATACFVTVEAPAHIGDREYYGGIIKAGISDWHATDGAIWVPLYQSPDAGLVLRGELTRDGMRGRVIQHDFDERGPADWLDFVAVRTGDATPALCADELRKPLAPPEST